MRKIVVSGGRVGHGDGPEVRAFGGEGAGVRVLEGDGLVSAKAEAIQDEPVEIGLGFRGRGVAAAGEEFETIAELETFEVRLDPGVFGVGGEADAELVRAGGVEQGDDAGENGLGEEKAFAMG